MVRQVRCVNERCPRAGIVAVVVDKQVARGVVARPPLHCATCGLHVAEVVPVVLDPGQAPDRPHDTQAKKQARRRQPARVGGDGG